MYPVLWETSYFAIYSYGFMVSLAILVSVFFMYRRAPREGYNPDQLLELVVAIVLVGLIGARLLFIFLNWEFYAGDLSRIFSIQAGGLSFHGAFAFGIIVGVLWTSWRGYSFWKLADFLAPYIFLGYTFARIGCFLNGCCYGIETDLPWGLPAAAVDNLPRHPVQLYASAASLLLFGVVNYLRKFSFFDGFVLIMVIKLYGVLRLVTGFFRADEIVWMNMSLAQMASLIMIAVLALALILAKTTVIPALERRRK